ncbi:unnamed protein product [Rotaria socialis]|uniref:CCHC-type domain-containing protein n=1 Tax=Rotaria socialis TaxID=392032 RepID=A0A820Z0Y4_9BILA|nr:unnamed protein product [Rotaria socialis]
MLELATIKLNGPAQEWYYHQEELISNWTLFKQVFLHAFPAPIQPTNIDYLAELLSRKQGEIEPVGKFVQDINRLCLKLDGKISEQDKLEYLRRGLRPKLQHYALSISSLQEFLTIMQHHEQISKEQVISYQNSSSFRSSPSNTSSKPQGIVNTSSYKSYGSDQQQPNLFVRQQSNYNYQSNYRSTNYESPDYYSRRNSNGWKSPQQLQQTNSYRKCDQCNKTGHTQQHCPDKTHLLIINKIFRSGATRWWCLR